jgi:hypothetical protein
VRARSGHDGAAPADVIEADRAGGLRWLVPLKVEQLLKASLRVGVEEC